MNWNDTSVDAIRSRYETHSLGEYQAQLARVVSRVERILAPLPIQCHVKHRVKAFDEYYAKWKGLEGAEEAGIGDMLGVRIICPFLDDLDEVEQALRRQLPIREVERKGEDHSFREFGYDSIHLQLDLAGETIPHELPGVLPVCEIQLRTILQDAWAEVEHELIYKSDWSIPTDKIKRKLAALNANLSLSDTIFQELRDFQKEVQHKQNRRREIQDTRVRMISTNTLSRRLEDLGHKAKKEVLEKLILQALTAHANESFSEAITLYSQALALPAADAIHSILLNHRGMAYFALEENHAAGADFRACLSLDENNYRAWYNLGLAHKALQQPDLALDAFARSIELNKTFADARVQHIGLLLASGRTGEAKTGVMLLRKCQPEHPDLPALDDALQRRSTPA